MVQELLACIWLRADFSRLNTYNYFRFPCFPFNCLFHFFTFCFCFIFPSNISFPYFLGFSNLICTLFLWPDKPSKSETLSTIGFSFLRPFFVRNSNSVFFWNVSTPMPEKNGV